MGDIDEVDENIDKYGAAICGRKWYSSPLMFCFKLVLQNAGQLPEVYDAKPMDLLEFCCRVTCHYLEIYGNPAEPWSREKISWKHNIDSSFDGINHTIIKLGKHKICTQ
ncbi:chimeric ERCC6-PGBD3 protein [Trichonephila clavipes]|nr:chimeric ERCC6-PGBD3 protein [Trichonephila clavipes]